MTTTLPVQRPLPLAVGNTAPVLALMQTCKHVLRVDEDDVLGLIADRQLVAFDLRTEGAARSFPAVWSVSLYFLAGCRCNEAPRQMFYSIDNPTTGAVVRSLFPFEREALRLREVMTAFGVTSLHLHRLLESGLLSGTGGDRVCKAPTISRASVVSFLEARRL